MLISYTHTIQKHSIPTWKSISKFCFQNHFTTVLEPVKNLRLVSYTSNNIEVKWDPPVHTTFSILKYNISIEALANTFDYTYSAELPGEKEKFNFSNLPGK